MDRRRVNLQLYNKILKFIFRTQAENSPNHILSDMISEIKYNT
jgi:hypothetical protein